MCIEKYQHCPGCYGKEFNTLLQIERCPRKFMIVNGWIPGRTPRDDDRNPCKKALSVKAEWWDMRFDEYHIHDPLLWGQLAPRPSFSGNMADLELVRSPPVSDEAPVEERNMSRRAQRQRLEDDLVSLVEPMWTQEYERQQQLLAQQLTEEPPFEMFKPCSCQTGSRNPGAGCIHLENQWSDPSSAKELLDQRAEVEKAEKTPPQPEPEEEREVSPAELAVPRPLSPPRSSSPDASTPEHKPLRPYGKRQNRRKTLTRSSDIKGISKPGTSRRKYLNKKGKLGTRYLP